MKSGAIVLASGMLLSALVWGMQVSQKNRYVTWDSLEPDTWASAWLIKRYIDPEAQIEIRPAGSPLSGGVGFAADSAEFKRTADQTAFAQLMSFHQVSDPALLALSEVLHAMEVAPWLASERRLEGDILARELLTLQQNYPEHLVPTDCYGMVFDHVYRHLETNDGHLLPELSFTEIQARPECQQDGNTLAERVLQPFVKEMTLADILHQIDAGKRVVFVDVREASEFNESHIPGAINLPLREVNEASVKDLQSADLVVSYCIKDFRGYEVALALAKLGIQQSSVMIPRGLNGWQQATLPVTGLNGLSDEAALDALMQCAKQGDCLKKG